MGSGDKKLALRLRAGSAGAQAYLERRRRAQELKRSQVRYKSAATAQT